MSDYLIRKGVLIDELEMLQQRQGVYSILSNAATKRKFEEFLITAFVEKIEGWQDELKSMFTDSEMSQDQSEKLIQYAEFAYGVLDRFTRL